MSSISFLTINEALYVATRALYHHLNNARVVLLGGGSEADSLYLSKEDSHKFYVHINRHIERRPSIPCDWLIARSKVDYSFFADLPQRTQSRIKFVSAPIDDRYFPGWMGSGKFIFPFIDLSINKFHPALDWCVRFKENLGASALAGMLALKMVLMFPVRSVQLVGFDFYRKPNGRLKKSEGGHDIRKNMDWLKARYNQDPRILINEPLLSILHLNPKRRP